MKRKKLCYILTTIQLIKSKVLLKQKVKYRKYIEDNQTWKQQRLLPYRAGVTPAEHEHSSLNCMSKSVNTHAVDENRIE